MKKRTLFTLLFACFTVTSYAQEIVKEKKKPVATYQVGKAKVIVWENVNKDGDTWKSYQIEKRYQTKDGEWKSSSSINDSELLELKKAIEKAILEEGLEEGGQ